MKLRHTPGPWKYNLENTHNDKSGRGTIPIYPKTQPSHEYSEIAEVIYYGKYGKANARLIAAAPKMLEALIEDCKKSYNRDIDNPMFKGNPLIKHKEIIEKVTGLSIKEIIE